MVFLAVGYGPTSSPRPPGGAPPQPGWLVVTAQSSSASVAEDLSPPVGGVRSAAQTQSEPRRLPRFARQPRRWKGADSTRLPLVDPVEITELLRAADLVSAEKLSVGVTRPSKLLLEKAGLRVHAVFHAIDDQSERRFLRGRFHRFFIDSYRSQIAAYELSLLLGLDSVPPTALRRHGGRRGSVQLWVEDAMTEQQRRQRRRGPPSRIYFDQQMSDMAVFHNLINNIDPNQGNILWDEDWNLWMIDHTRSFARDRRLPRPEQLQRCSRPLWEALQGWDEDLVRQRLSPYLGKPEITALQARWEVLMELFRERIAKDGEAAVLFTYPPEQPW